MYINPPVLGDAIVALRPGSEFALKFGDDYNLEWLDPTTTPPTKEESEKKLEELLQDYYNKEYQRQRGQEYPSFAEQFDLLYHGGYDAWKAEIDKIKDKYPKPE